jgi:hypothetical protein
MSGNVASDVEALTAERDSLLVSLGKQLLEKARIEVERDSLLRDALRYRWLREYQVAFKTKYGLDASVDKLMTPDAEIHETEVEANARRYVWLVDSGPNGFPLGPYVVGCPSRDKLDAAIDEAMKGEKLP